VEEEERGEGKIEGKHQRIKAGMEVFVLRVMFYATVFVYCITKVSVTHASLFCLYM
jgi:hypothetical protein